jgi:hypothetical protein
MKQLKLDFTNGCAILSGYEPCLAVARAQRGCLHFVDSAKGSGSGIYRWQRVTQLWEQALKERPTGLKLVMQTTSKDAASESSEPILCM